MTDQQHIADAGLWGAAWDRFLVEVGRHTAPLQPEQPIPEPEPTPDESTPKPQRRRRRR